MGLTELGIKLRTIERIPYAQMGNAVVTFLSRCGGAATSACNATTSACSTACPAAAASAPTSAAGRLSTSSRCIVVIDSGPLLLPALPRVRPPPHDALLRARAVVFLLVYGWVDVGGWMRG